jgi:hypothetical protein
MRVLACGGLGVLFWEALQGNLRKKAVVEVCPHVMASYIANWYSVVVYAGHVILFTLGAANVLVYGVIQTFCHTVGLNASLSVTRIQHNLQRHIVHPILFSLDPLFYQSSFGEVSQYYHPRQN